MKTNKLELPNQKYGLIYADPGWAYSNKKTGGGMNSAANQKYLTMSLEELKWLNIPSISKPDCVLFLWTTVPLLPWGFDVMKHWNFKYKNAIFWHKSTRRGMGYWTRGDVELLLVGVKGKVKPFRSSRSNHISHPRLAHSEKPEVFREFIEEITRPQEELLSPRIELFARKTGLVGWESWGNET